MNIFYLWFFLLLLGFLTFFTLGLNLLLMGTKFIFEYSLFKGSMNMGFLVLLDWMGVIFFSVVLLISSVVMLYCVSYMGHEPHKKRFCFLVLLFVFSMGLFILSPNLMSLLLGWDGLGLISYCLVIYYPNFKSFNSGMLTVLLNRIGDVGILLGISVLVSSGSWNFIFMLSSNSFLDFLLVFLIMLGAMTKSAQVPFSSWLPAAMAAPTPVSSLVHSSTLVTAGVFLLIRFIDVVGDSLKEVLMLISLVTLLLGGLGACFEMDFKKVIALSTLSQLGFMMFTLSLGFWEFAYFHLLIHAIFKALLFLCAGFMIHSLMGYQDIRNLGSLTKVSPIVSLGVLVSFLSLCGLPFSCGFYSKDLIVEIYFLTSKSLFIFISFFLGVLMTVLYSSRLVFYLFLFNYEGPSFFSLEENRPMSLSIGSMSFLGVFFGSLVQWLLLDYTGGIYLSLFFKVLVLSFVVLLIFFYFILNFNQVFFVALNVSNTSNFLSSMWFLSFLVSLCGSWLGQKISKLYTRGDESWGEILGGVGTHQVLSILSKKVQFYQYNVLTTQFSLFLFLVLFLLVF